MKNFLIALALIVALFATSCKTDDPCTQDGYTTSSLYEYNGETRTILYPDDSTKGTTYKTYDNNGRMVFVVDCGDKFAEVK